MKKTTTTHICLRSTTGMLDWRRTVNQNQDPKPARVRRPSSFCRGLSATCEARLGQGKYSHQSAFLSWPKIITTGQEMLLIVFLISLSLSYYDIWAFLQKYLYRNSLYYSIMMKILWYKLRAFSQYFCENSHCLYHITSLSLALYHYHTMIMMWYDINDEWLNSIFVT